MMISPTFFRSLLVTLILSVSLPVVLVGFALIGLNLLGYIPVVEAISHSGSQRLLTFLTVFGNGDAWEGMLVISLTCGLVGALFDTYAFYRHQNLRNG